MRRLALLTILAAAAVAAPASAPAAPPATAAVPTAATLDGCHTSEDALGRYALFTAQMGSVDGSARMQVRFDVGARAVGARRYKSLLAPGLGRWRSSLPAVGKFILHKQVVNLPAGSDVRATVSFRWLDSHATVIRRAQLHTPACHVADVRPDLVVDGLTAQATGDPSQLRYVVAVRNAGIGDAGAFDVALSVAGATQTPQPVGGLVAGERRSVAFTAPRCASGNAVEVTLDPGNRIDEVAERDDARLFACPAP